MWPISKRKTKNQNQNFVICFLIWNEKTNFKKYISFFIFDYWIEKRKTKKNPVFWIYFDLKSISKKKNQNFRIHFLIPCQKMNFKKLFHFSVLVMKLKNEKLLKFALFLNKKTNYIFGTRIIISGFPIFKIAEHWNSNLKFVFRFSF